MIRLHYVPSAASMAPHLVLQELKVPFELVLIDKDGGELQSAAYRAMNPNGLIPVLSDGDLVLFEASAICLHLADTYGAGAWLPPLGSPARAQVYKWMSWLSTTLQQTLILYFYPERWATAQAAIDEVRQRAQQKVLLLLEQVDAQLGSHSGPFLLGEDISLPDLYALMLCRWTRNFDGKKARDFQHMGPWLAHLLERPAVQRVFEREALAKPWV